MSTAAEAASADPTPCPAPASEVQLTPRERFKRAAARRRDALDLSVYEEMRRLYEGDPLRELQALAAGTHPQQRELDPAKLDESKQLAAAGLAREPVASDE